MSLNFLICSVEGGAAELLLTFESLLPASALLGASLMDEGASFEDGATDDGAGLLEHATKVHITSIPKNDLRNFFSIG